MHKIKIFCEKIPDWCLLGLQIISPLPSPQLTSPSHQYLKVKGFLTHHHTTQHHTSYTTSHKTSYTTCHKTPHTPKEKSKPSHTTIIINGFLNFLAYQLVLFEVDNCFQWLLHEFIQIKRNDHNSNNAHNI